MISEETVEKLTNKRTTGYERVRYGSTYYTGNCSTVKTFEERSECFDSETYESGNYYSDPDVAANNVRADKLMRQLRRFAVENRKSDIDWANDRQDKYYLYYDCLNEKIFINYTNSWKNFGQIYFDTEEIAQLAIKIFEDELLWYFTEYRDSL